MIENIALARAAKRAGDLGKERIHKSLAKMAELMAEKAERMENAK